MRRIVLFMILLPGMLVAEEMRDLAGSGARNALENRKLVYENGAWQEFRASGRTLYNAGEDSWGYWEIRGDRYCSMWPPSDLWACYALQTDGVTVRFIDDSGEASSGTYAD